MCMCIVYGRQHMSDEGKFSMEYILTLDPKESQVRCESSSNTLLICVEDECLSCMCSMYRILMLQYLSNIPKWNTGYLSTIWIERDRYNCRRFCRCRGRTAMAAFVFPHTTILPTHLPAHTITDRHVFVSDKIHFTASSIYEYNRRQIQIQIFRVLQLHKV